MPRSSSKIDKLAKTLKDNVKRRHSALQGARIKEDLALAYNIIAHLCLDDHTYTHLSSRSVRGDSFHILPFGLRFEEVTASNLLEVDYDGNILSGTEQHYNKTGYFIHGAIYKARPDINSVFHIHTPAIVAVSAMEQGLVPCSQWALHFYGKISYHYYDSLVLDEAQGRKLVSELGDNYNMLLRNHGSLTCGRTVKEAMFYTYHLEQACQTQCLTMATGTKLSLPPKQICEQSVKDLLSFEKDLGDRDWQAWIRMISNTKSLN